MDLDNILDDALNDLEACSWQPHSQIDKTAQSARVEKDEGTGVKDSENKEEKKSEDAQSMKNNQEMDVIDEAVATVNASVKESRAHTIENGEDEMKDFIKTLLASFDENTTEEQLEVNLRKMMGSFFNTESLKEPIQTIAEKYPRWLRENEGKLDKKELENHQKQCELYSQVWEKLQKSSGDDKNNVNMEEVMDLLTKTFAYGCLPNEVMDGMMPDELKQFANHMQQLEKDLEVEDEEKRKDNTENSKKKDDNPPLDSANSQEMLDFLKTMMNEENSNEPPDSSQLSPDELKRMRELMQSDCLLM